MDANIILNLLLQRFKTEDFLNVPECKIGSSYFMKNCQRFDLWSMARSYSNPRFVGVEIKTSRSDYIGDDKWPGYLRYCTEFYFATAYGVIKSGEIPEQAGWLETSKNHKKLITKKKAPVREVQIPQSILLYILMSRSRIIDQAAGVDKLEYWRRALDVIEQKKHVGHEVAYKISKAVREGTKKIELENKRLERENEAFQDIKEAIAELKIPIQMFGFTKQQAKFKIKELIGDDLIKKIEDSAQELLEVSKNLRGVLEF